MLRAEHAFTPDFKALVVQTLSPYVSSDANSLDVDGTPVSVSQDQAVMYALLLNELGTNATKYGAWSTRDGCVRVDWALRPDAAGAEKFVITWRETGGPPVEPPTRKGFGTALAAFAVERTLKGRLTTDYLPTGVVVTIELPWTDATAAGASSAWTGLKDLKQRAKPTV
jgi:two-component sensor histidine kinase